MGRRFRWRQTEPLLVFGRVCNDADYFATPDPFGPLPMTFLHRKPQQKLACAPEMVHGTNCHCAHPPLP